MNKLGQELNTRDKDAGKKIKNYNIRVVYQRDINK